MLQNTFLQHRTILQIANILPESDCVLLHYPKLTSLFQHSLIYSNFQDPSLSTNMAPQCVWYLNDSVINDYFKLIKKENPDTYGFDTYFYLAFSTSGYEKVKRWTKNVDIFSKRKVFFPINIVDNNFAHWILIVADIVNQEVVYYDSLPGYHFKTHHCHIMEYLGLEHREKLGTPFPVEDWSFKMGINPHQENGIDCGVFVCTFAEYLSRDAAFNFSQENMMSFRKLIAYELMKQRLVRLNVHGDEIDDEISRITYDYLASKCPNVTFR